MKLSDPRLAALAASIREDRCLVIAIAALVKEKHATAEIATILECDQLSIDPLATEVMTIFERETRARAGKKEKRVSKRPSPLTKDWKVSAEDSDYARKWGFSEQEIVREALNFRDYWVSCGKSMLDWSGTWKRRIRDQAVRFGKPVPAYEEAVASVPKQSMAVDPETWRKAVAEWRRTGRWHRALGPEPNQAGCRVPGDVLRSTAA